MNTEELQAYYRTFNKIKLWNEISNQILNFGLQYTNPSLADYVDMNCGGIPEGDFEQVVDLHAPEQFISMYLTVAEKRFAFVVSALLSVSQDFLTPIKSFCEKVGKDLNLGKVDSIEKARQLVKDFVLNENPQAAWEKANGDIKVFYLLEQCFLKGLLEASDIKATVSEEGEITLSN